MSTQRDLYAELNIIDADSDTAVKLLEDVAEVASTTDADVRSDFSTLLHVIQEKPVLCAKALITWLADPPKEDAAKALLSSVSVTYLTADAPVDIVFPATTPSAVVIAGCRMNARYMSPAYALGWVLGLLRTWPDDATAIEGANALLHYLARDFPATLHKLFNNIQPELFAPQVSEIILHYKTQIDDERCLRESYPFLKELAMSPEERDVVRTLERQFQKDVQRGVEKKSIFMQFAKRRKFKYARIVSFGTTTQSIGGETVIAMKQYSVETELPLSEWLDPISGIQARNNLWQGNLE